MAKRANEENVMSEAKTLSSLLGFDSDDDDDFQTAFSTETGPDRCLESTGILSIIPHVIVYAFRIFRLL